VVAGRAHKREAAPVGRLDRAASGEQRGVVARFGGDRVGVEQPRQVDRLQRVDVSRFVAALYLFARGRRRLDDLEGFEQRLESRPRLDVRLRRMELRQCRMAYDVDRTASTSSSRGLSP
jgi:hypothetical protein